jgi:hypothetical protein
MSDDEKRVVGERMIEINGESFKALLLASYEHIREDGTVEYDIELRFSNDDKDRLQAALEATDG